MVVGKQASSRPIPLRKTALASAVAMASQVLAAPQAAAEEAAAVEEVVVTARKRRDNLQDVPVSVQAFTADRIEELGIHRFEDFAVLAPSISFVSWLPGTQMMFIRGIADGSNPNRANTATATMYLDEQPLTYAGGIADLHNYDIERIEVLNGPQGTYYGASATSGTVRIITNKPDPARFEAGTDVTLGLIDEGDNMRTAEGFANIPVSERTAVRIVGWYDESTGFVDNIARTRTYKNGASATNSPFVKEDYNEERTVGLRAAARTEFQGGWRATLSGFWQGTEIVGAWDHDPVRVAELEVARFGPEFGELDVGQVALTVEGDLGIADIVYAGAYFDRHRQHRSDYSDYVEYASFGSWIQQFACSDFYWYGNVGCNDPSMFYDADFASERWSHEVRLTSSGESRFNWVVGAYAEQNESDNLIFWDMPGIQHEGAPGAYYVANNGGSPLPNEWWSADWRGDWEQVAVFGEASFDVMDRLQATVGLRAFESEFGGDTAWAGYFYDAKTFSADTAGSTDDTIFKFSLTLDATDSLLAYFTYAEGFRPGGGNAEGATNPSVPEIYQPDVLDSYEIGWKATLAGGRATFNGAVYTMQWQDFQTSIYDLLISPLIFRANAGDAEVQGFEAELQAALTPNLFLQVAATMNDSVLAEDFNSTVDPSVVWAEAGRELPYVPRWKFSATSRYEWEQAGGVTGHAQMTWSFTDESWNLLITEPFQAQAVPKRQAAYSLLDLRVGWDVASRYAVEVFATNLLDERAQIFINTGNYDERITTNRPRTFGLRWKTRID